MAGTQRAPGGTGKSSDQTGRSGGKFLGKPGWGGIGAIAGVVGAIAAVLAILIPLLTSGQHPRQDTSAAVVRFSHLRTLTIPRFGFIFSYPSDWDLPFAPVNTDGAEFVNPNDRAVSITGYGTHGSFSRYPNLLDAEKGWKHLILSLKDSRIIEEAASGTFVKAGAAMNPIDGWRVVYQYVNDHGHSVTDMVKVAVADGREVVLDMEAPTREFPRYKEAFLKLSDKLLLLAKCGECSAQ
jgi:hypothetical protein